MVAIVKQTSIKYRKLYCKCTVDEGSEEIELLISRGTI